MTVYSQRALIACPDNMRALGNALAGALGEVSQDAGTFDQDRAPAVWLDADGNRYALRSLQASEGFAARAEALIAAQGLGNMVVVNDGPAAPGKIVAVIGDAPTLGDIGLAQEVIEDE